MALGPFNHGVISFASPSRLTSNTRNFCCLRPLVPTSTSNPSSDLIALSGFHGLGFFLVNGFPFDSVSGTDIPPV